MKTGKPDNQTTGKPEGRRAGRVRGMRIRYHWELDVYELAREGRRRIFELSKDFSREEVYSLTDQIRRSSRSVCAQIAEAWGRRLYRDDFVNRLNQAESEARETQRWLETAVECEYVTQETGKELFELYHEVIGKLINMENNPDDWVIARKTGRPDNRRAGEDE